MTVEEPTNAWEWLQNKNWKYLSFHAGYQSPDSKYFITESMMYMLPGEVCYFLKTGYIRNPRIFDTGYTSPTPQSLGLRAHKDGRCVAIRRVK